MIRITSKQGGFRRCGIAHSQEPKEYPDGRFTGPQLDILQAEPMLTVTFSEDESKQTDKASGGTVRPNAEKSIELVKAAATVEDLEQLAGGEDRRSVLGAIDKRRAELTKVAE